VAAPTTVTVSVSIHPLTSVKVIVVVPAAIPVTTPVVAFIVALLVSEEVHADAVAGAEVLFKSKLLLPTHTVNTLVAEVITGNALIVTTCVFVQPLTSVKVIVVVPAEIPVTTPVVAFIVALLVSEEVHADAVAGAEVLFKSKLLLPTHTVNTLVADVITGKALTVNTAIFAQPAELVKVISVVPDPTLVTNPVAVTVATAVFEELQVPAPAGVAVN
jgi:hypothetical protein